jgi:hypothetical protein
MVYRAIFNEIFPHGPQPIETSGEPNLISMEIEILGDKRTEIINNIINQKLEYKTYMGFPYADDDLYDFDWDPNIDVMVLDFINDMLIDSTTENIYKLQEYSRLNLNLRNILKDSETSIYDIFNNIFYQMKKHFEDEESNGSSEFSYTIEKI